MLSKEPDGKSPSKASWVTLKSQLSLGEACSFLHFQIEEMMSFIMFIRSDVASVCEDVFVSTGCSAAWTGAATAMLATAPHFLFFVPISLTKGFSHEALLPSSWNPS